MYACICHNLTDRRLRQAIQDTQAEAEAQGNHHKSACDIVAAVQAKTGTCTGCGRCGDYVAMVVSEETGVAVSAEALLSTVTAQAS